MLFRKKSKSPIMLAIKHSNQITKIAYKYIHDKHYQPTKSDLARFSLLTYLMRRRYFKVKHINKIMRRRFKEQRERKK